MHAGGGQKQKKASKTGLQNAAAKTSIVIEYKLQLKIKV